MPLTVYVPFVSGVLTMIPALFSTVRLSTPVPLSPIVIVLMSVVVKSPLNVKTPSLNAIVPITFVGVVLLSRTFAAVFTSLKLSVLLSGASAATSDEPST